MKKVLIIIIVFSLLFIGFFIINKNNKETKQQEKATGVEKVTKTFFANTKITKNFTQYKAGFGNDLKNISLNKIEIVDDRTSLKGTALLSEENLDNVKIKILPCSEMPLSINKNEQILGDCFEINPGTSYKFSKTDYLTFPRKLFKNIGDYNFGYSKNEGGVFINKFNNEPCKDCGDGKFYTRNYIDKPQSDIKNEIYYNYSSFNSYFNGYYYISFSDRKKISDEIKKKFGIEIKNGFFEKDGKIFAVNNHKDKFLLKGVVSDNFDVFYIGHNEYIKDKNYLYFIKDTFGEPCNVHGYGCTLKNVEAIKIVEIKDKDFSIYDKDKQIIKIDKKFYLLNDRSIYEIDIKNSKFNKLLKLNYILSKDKIIYLNRNNILEDVDIKSFKSIGGEYFADKNNLYIYGRKVKLDFKFDYNTIEAYESGLLKDKNGIYMKKWVNSDTFENKNNLVSDVKSFKKIACKNRGCYFKDKKKVYFHWGDRSYFENFNADPKTFEHFGNLVAKDKNNLYSGSSIFKDVDVKSFLKIGRYSNFIYFKDKNSYYKSAGTWIEKVDKKEIPFNKLVGEG